MAPRCVVQNHSNAAWAILLFCTGINGEQHVAASQLRYRSLPIAVAPRTTTQKDIYNRRTLHFVFVKSAQGI